MPAETAAAAPPEEPPGEYSAAKAAVLHWGEFSYRVKRDAGLVKRPYAPKLEFFLKYLEIAMAFWAEKRGDLINERIQKLNRALELRDNARFIYEWTLDNYLREYGHEFGSDVKAELLQLQRNIARYDRIVERYERVLAASGVTLCEE